jgi:eukaryotic-like serine/threonine-protein kinase
MMTPPEIDRYQIIEEIRHGGMAIIYLAHDPRFGRDVALKVLSLQLKDDDTFRKRFEQEAKIIASLEFPAIVPVYDFGYHGGRPFLVMRLMLGGSLLDLMQRKKLAIRDVARILETVAPALDKAHENGVIHRDLKPANILFDLDNNPYISDFGIAKFSASRATLTGEEIIGTAAYMSPEQARGESGLDGRSDIYSLGVMLFEMLTGMLPFQAETPMGLAMRHIMDPAPSIREYEPKLPPQADAIVLKALAKKRDARYPSASALARDISFLSRSFSADSQRPDETSSSLPEIHSEENKHPSSSGTGEATFIEIAVCGNCGFKLDPKTGPCPSCGSTRRLRKPMAGRT